MADQESIKKVNKELEDEKQKIAALVGESSGSLPEVADMMSEKGDQGGMYVCMYAHTYVFIYVYNVGR